MPTEEDKIRQLDADVQSQTADLDAAVAAESQEEKLQQLDIDVKARTAKLQQGVQSNQPKSSPLLAKGTDMATGIAPIDQLVTDVASEDTVIASAITLINGFQAALAAGIAAALAGGATAAQLGALSSLDLDVTTETTTLAGAVAANTPAAGASTGPPPAAAAKAPTKAPAAPAPQAKPPAKKT